MKFSLAVVASLFMAASAVALPAEAAEAAADSRCPRARNAVPFYRNYHVGTVNHFYTTNQWESQNAVNALGYTAEGQVGRVYTSAESSTVPLYRLFHGGVTNHFYTTNKAEADNATRSSGYTLEGVAAYIFKDQICGSVPLFRLYHPGRTNHFYTTNWNERNNAIATLGYSDEGVAGYIIPSLCIINQ